MRFTFTSGGFSRLLLAIPAVAALAAAGCKSAPAPEPQPTCSRWSPGGTAGPGDAGQHFPYATGNRWVVDASTLGGGWLSQDATGTRSVLGHTATVLAVSDLDGGQALTESYVAVDDHGVLELGGTPASTDPVSALILPYYSARFPLAVGDRFTAFTCTNLDYGEDLDGDGKNERLDAELVVAVTADESVVTKLDAYLHTFRLEKTLTATLHLTGQPGSATDSMRVVDWQAPGVGMVREVTEAPVGSPGPPIDLVGYVVGSRSHGLLARRTLATRVAGPYAAVGLGGRYLVLGRDVGLVAEPARVVGIPMVPGGAVLAPLDVLTLPSGTEISVPGVAAGNGFAAILVSTWLGGDVRLQRVSTSGALLEPAAGRVIGSASSTWGTGCGPAIATGGSGFLAAWPGPEGGAVVSRLGPDGSPLGSQVLQGGVCPVVAFDGTRFLVVYESGSGLSPGMELRAVHVTVDGSVSAPFVLSATPGEKHPIAMVYDGTAHVLLLEDGRNGIATQLTLRRLDAEGAWLDGDAATGGLVLLPEIPTMNGAPLHGATLTLDGSMPVAAWGAGATGNPWASANEAWVMRLAPDGSPLDLHRGLPGVNTYLGDPIASAEIDQPFALGAASGLPEVLYSSCCDYGTSLQTLRGIRFGL